MKKTLVLLLFIFCSIAFIGCKNVEYSLSIEISSQTIYEGEMINYLVKVNPDNVAITDYQFESSDESIFTCMLGKITGVTKGSATLIISTIYKGKNIEKKITITVNEEVLSNIYRLEVTAKNILEIGETVSITVKEATENTVISNFEVFISNEKICKYENNLLVGLAVGTTKVTITAMYKTFTITDEVTVEVKAADDTVSVVCNIPSEMYVDQAVVVSVSLMPQNIAITDFSLVISNQNIIAYYSSEKTLEAFDTGNTKITITFTYNGKSYEVKQDILIKPALSLDIAYNSDITVGDIIDLVITIKPLDIIVNEFATNVVNKTIVNLVDGKLTALAAGDCQISISTQYQGITIYGLINVKVKVFVPNTISSDINNFMFVNENKPIKVELLPLKTNINDYQITSSNSSVIEIGDGKLTAKALGTSVVKISYLYNGETLTEETTIDVVQFSSVGLVMKEDLKTNEVVFYELVAYPSNKVITDFVYSSSDQNVLLVNGHACYAKKSGEAKIKATYQYLGVDYSSELTLTITDVVYEIERLLITGSSGLLVGGTATLTVAKYPSIATGIITYSTSDATIASVSETGAVTGENGGKCVITAQTQNTFLVKATFNITVISANEVSEMGGARYYEGSIKNYNELLNGVVHTTYLGYSSTQTSGIDADGYGGITETIVTGKYYSQQVNVLSVPSNTNTKVIPWANLTKNVWTLTTVKGLIEDYEKKNPGSKVIAAVNGDFFDINGEGNLPYQTIGENIADGEFYKTTNGFGAGGGTIGFTNDGSTNTLVSRVTAERTPHMILAVYDASGNIIKEFPVQNLNSAPTQNGSSVYFGVYNSSKSYVPQTVPAGTCYVVGAAELALPNNANDFYGLGVISSTVPRELEKGQFAIVSHDAEVQLALAIGVRIRVQYEYTGELSNIKSATGYNGIIYEDPTSNIVYTDGNLLSRAPRTVIGMKADGTLVMMVVDGRQGASGMYGADGYELAAIMNAYGCVRAYNVDGGGSSTVVIRTENGFQVMNSPSDGRERTDANCILIVTEDPNYTATAENITATSATVSIHAGNDDYKNFKTHLLVENVWYDVNNGKVDFSDLISNTTYSYQLFYTDNDGITHQTSTIGTFKTLKDGFELYGITITETIDNYIVNVYYSDLDEATNINTMTITLNGIKAYLSNGMLTLKKSTFGSDIVSVSFEYWINYGVKTETIKLDGECYFRI